MELNAENAAGMRDLFMIELKQEHHITQQVINAVPADKLSWRPHEKNKTFAEIASHIYEAAAFFQRFIEGVEPAGQPEPEPPTTKPELLNRCEELHRDFVIAVANYSGDTLAKVQPFYFMGDIANIMLLRLNLNHLIHHRAQLHLYLRLMGELCPSVYGPTADVTMDELKSQAGQNT